MRHINALMNGTQYTNLHILLMEAKDRAKDSILTSRLSVEEIEELEELL